MSVARAPTGRAGSAYGVGVDRDLVRPPASLTCYLGRGCGAPLRGIFGRASTPKDPLAGGSWPHSAFGPLTCIIIMATRKGLSVSGVADIRVPPVILGPNRTLVIPGRPYGTGGALALVARDWCRRASPFYGAFTVAGVAGVVGGASSAGRRGQAALPTHSRGRTIAGVGGYGAGGIIAAHTPRRRTWFSQN